MKRTMLIAMAVMMCASLAAAQGGWIQIAADLGGVSCTYTTASGTMNFVYQIHQASPGTTLSRYKLLPSAPAQYIWIFDNFLPNSAIGSSPAGVAVAYGSCKVSPWNIGSSGWTMLDFGGCTSLTVVFDPASTSGTIESIDCTLPVPLKFVAGGSVLTYNAGGAYTCDPICGQITPIRDSSWGRVKKLYN